MQMVSRSETGPPDSTASTDTSAADEPRTCIACRKAKVKCDMAVPCNRCTRLSLECVPTPPSRRGRQGDQQTKRRRRTVGLQAGEPDRASPMPKYNATVINAMVINMCANGLERVEVEPVKEEE
jgi:hypothetical protein